MPIPGYSRACVHKCPQTHTHTHTWGHAPAVGTKKRPFGATGRVSWPSGEQNSSPPQPLPPAPRPHTQGPAGLIHTHVLLTRLGQKPLWLCGAAVPTPLGRALSANLNRGWSNARRLPHLATPTAAQPGSRYTAIRREAWCASAPGPQTAGNEGPSHPEAKAQGQPPARSRRLRRGDQERASSVEQREGRMGPPLGTAHAEARGLRLRGPLPSRSSSSTQPHTHTQATDLTPGPPLGRVTEAPNVRNRKGPGTIGDPAPSSQCPPFLEDFLDK